MLTDTFYIQVGVVCSSRMHEFFIITLMSGSETTRHHQRDFAISPPPNVDVCTIRPRISVGNAAGTSSIQTFVAGKFPFWPQKIKLSKPNYVFITILCYSLSG